MVIAVNIRVLSGNSAINQLLMNYFEQMAADHPGHEFILIAEKEFVGKQKPYQNIKRMVLPQQSDNPLRWKIWYNYKLPSVLKKIKADLLITADGVCSLRTKVPQYLLVNDLAFLEHPEWYSKKYLRFIKLYTAFFLQKANAVITFSDVLKRKIVKFYNVAENKITVIQAVAGKQYQPFTWEEKEQVKEKFTEGKEYFLFSGAIHPRSNLVNLLKAFSLFKKRQKSNMHLIIASQHISEDEPFVESLKLYKYRHEIKLMTAIDENTLSEITAASYACINMSPLHHDVTSLLNAMQCGVPVIAGNLQIAIELLDDAALFADAATPENIAEKLMLLYKDESKRNDMIKKVLLQSSKYNSNETTSVSWEDILITKQQA